MQKECAPKFYFIDAPEFHASRAALGLKVLKR